MIEQLVNNGITVLNQENPAVSEKTMIVLGVARSGTSMVAGVLESIGVFMGTHKDRAVLEDVEIADLLESGKDLKKISAFIRRRDKKYPLWGWKRPGALSYMQTYEKMFRHPHYIIVFRDSLAIALRNKISVAADLLQNLQATHQQYAQVIDFISSTDQPCFLVSYEKALQKRTHFVESLCHYVGLGVDADRIRCGAAAIELDKPTYLYASRSVRYMGYFGGLNASGNIYGWAAHNTRVNEEVELDLLIDGCKVTTFKADHFREDLLNTGQDFGHGRHGFNLDIRPYVEIGKSHSVSIQVKADAMPLTNSPRNLCLKE